MAFTNLQQDKAYEIAGDIWWVGHYLPGDPFQCHVYLIKNGRNSVLIDPGSMLTFDMTLKKIESVIPFEDIRYFICHHQDPDIAGALSKIDAMVTRDDAVVLSHWRTNALLKHYNLKMPLQCVEAMGWNLDLGEKKLSFIFTPYLHFAGAFTTFIESSGVLFSSDLFGGFTEEFHLFVEDDSYFDSIKLFHEHYMPSREILRHSLNKFKKLDLKLIAPQHGSIIPFQFIKNIISHLENLECGIFLETTGDTDIFRLSKTNRIITGFFKNIISKLNFDDIIQSLKEDISTIFPVEKIDFFLKDKSNNYGQDDDRTYYGLPVHGLNVENVEFIGRKKSEWEEVHDGWWLVYEDRTIAVPLFTSEYDILYSYSIITLKEEVEIGKDISDIMKDISVPLGIAFERELMLRKAESESSRYYEQSIKDNLTGLHTRHFMKEALLSILKGHDRKPETNVAAIVFDIDHFKRVNDNFGHHAGDTVLKIVADMILHSIRAGDVDVRLGGEEFAVFVVDPDKEVAKKIAERISLEVANHLFSVPLEDLHITISGGIAYRKKGETLNSFLDRADFSMYESKKNGRNRITVYS